MTSINIRSATSQDTSSILEMPPYSKCTYNQLSYEENIIIAEDEKKIIGAVSCGSKKISFIDRDWKDDFEQCSGSLKEVTGSWISKLYIFPKYRNQGIGINLVKAALENLEQKNVTEVYAGIYIKNEYREISTHIFEKNGFKRIGSCVCPLDIGYCRGILLKKRFSKQRQQ